MLFMPVGASKPIRIQGTFVRDEEITRPLNFIKKGGRAMDNAGSGKPSIILAHTVKGKGVSFMENQCSWHGAAPNQEQYDIAMAELSARLKELEG